MGKRRLVILILGIILSLRGSIGQTLPDACPGSRVRYSVQGLPNSVFAWNVSQGGSIITSYNDSVDVQWDKNQGSYQLSVTEVTINNCTGPHIIATVNVLSDTANLGGNQAICVGNLAQFSPDMPFSRYLWSTGDTTSFTKTGIPGIVWVEVTTPQGCKSRDSVDLTVHPLTAIDLGTDRPVCDTSVTLTGPFAASTYYWTITNANGDSTNEFTQSIEVNKAVGIQTVSLRIVDATGCTNSDTVRMLECSNVLGIMNTITPDNNGINDYWVIKNIEIYPKAVISLYDRWGRLVFMKNGNYQNGPNDGEGFNGKGPNGKLLPMDSYFYVIDLKDGSKPITGYLLIIK